MPVFAAISGGGQALRDRFRSIFLTSITTVAGMLPLLLVLPAAYAIMEDLGVREVAEEEMALTG